MSSPSCSVGGWGLAGEGGCGAWCSGDARWCGCAGQVTGCGGVVLTGSVGRGAVTGEPRSCRSDLEADGVEPGERVDEFAGDLDPAEGNKLLSIIRRGSGSVVRWRRSQIVLWSAQRMSVAQIAEIAFTSPDRVREVIHNFNTDGFDSLAPKYSGGRPPNFTLPERQQVKRIGLSRPSDHGLPFSTWSLKPVEAGRVPGR